MKDDDKAMIVCSITKYPGLPGSWKRCSKCFIKVFLCNSSLKSLDKTGIKRENIMIYCLKCALPNIEKVKFMPPTEEQVNEIETYFKNKSTH